MGEFYLSTDYVLNNENPINQQVYSFLRRSIIECRLLPDDTLSENDVAAGFKISRQPVREALIKLSENDFVTISPKKATKVKRISKSHVLQGVFIRETLESEVISRSIDVISEESLNALEEILNRQQDAASHYHIHEHFALDEEFHRTIILSTGYDKVYTIVESLKGIMDRVRFLSIEHEVSPITRTCASHAHIFEALKRRDGPAAALAMREHMRETAASLEEVIAKSNPNFFDA